MSGLIEALKVPRRNAVQRELRRFIPLVERVVSLFVLTANSADKMRNADFDQADVCLYVSIHTIADHLRTAHDGALEAAAVGSAAALRALGQKGDCPMLLNAQTLKYTDNELEEFMEWSLILVALAIIAVAVLYFGDLLDSIREFVELLMLPFQGVAHLLGRRQEKLFRQRLYFQTSLPPDRVETLFRDYFSTEQFHPAHRVLVLADTPGHLVIGVAYSDSVRLQTDNGRSVKPGTEPTIVAEISFQGRPGGTSGTFQMTLMPENPSDLEKAQIKEVPVYSMAGLANADPGFQVMPEKEAIAKGLRSGSLNAGLGWQSPTGSAPSAPPPALETNSRAVDHGFTPSVPPPMRAVAPAPPTTRPAPPSTPSM